jgi:hypothetical protein
LQQENYLKTQPAKVSKLSGKDAVLEQLKLMDRAASSISDGDLVDTMIHGFATFFLPHLQTIEIEIVQDSTTVVSYAIARCDVNSPTFFILVWLRPWLWGANGDVLPSVCYVADLHSQY